MPASLPGIVPAPAKYLAPSGRAFSRRRLWRLSQMSRVDDIARYLSCHGRGRNGGFPARWVRSAGNRRGDASPPAQERHNFWRRPLRAGRIRHVADRLADVRRVRQVADVFGPASTALCMRKVAERALEHDDEEVRRASRISYSRSSSGVPRCGAVARWI